MRTKLNLVLLLILPLFAIAQRPLVEGWNENKVDIIKGSGIYNVPCMIRLPDGYFLSANASTRYPVIFAFHGMGEQGTDTVKVLNTGLCKNLSNDGATSYTHEGTSKSLGSDAPAALDKNGNMREAIIVAAQRSSYSVDPAWFPGMFEDITTRLRIDSSMVYLYGYSAGNWPASGIISNNTDTTYNRFVTAIHSSSGATQDLDWSGVSKIGKRNIPFFAVTGDGGSETSYKEQAIKEVDSIDNASPNPLPVHVIMSGQGHCCFDSRAANSTTYSALGGKNLIQWFFQYANPYATTWTPANINPDANAGSDQTITLPTSSVTLAGSGTDADGTIVSHVWSKVSGPSNYTITSPNSYNTTVTGLEAGTYVFRLTVTDDDAAADTDDIQITVNAAPQSGDTILVNIYGGTNAYNNNAWNNWDVSSNLTSSTFNYSNGTSSGVSATLSLSQGIADNGSSYGGSMCPPEVLRYASFSTSNRTLVLNNLEAGYSYDFEFYSSRANSGNATIFTIGSQSDTVVTDNNKTVTVNFLNIEPDGTNKITVSLARLSGTTYQYLNGFRIIKHSGTGSRAYGPRPPTEETPRLLRTLQLQPNPASSWLNITYSRETPGRVQVALYDVSGRAVISEKVVKPGMVFQHRINIGSLGSGVYYVVVTEDNGKKWEGMFIKN